MYDLTMERPICLNRDSASPLYYQLKEYIKEAIIKGQYKPNDRLPTEEELCKVFSVSRPVVRQAYSLLIREGLVERQKGSGTFVKQRVKRNSLFTEFVTFSFEENVVDLDKNSEILKLEKIVDPRINKIMGLPMDSEVVHIIRRIHEMEYPVSLIESYLPCKYFQNFENFFFTISSKPILGILESTYGLYIQNVHRELNPIQISEEKAKILHAEEKEMAYEITTKYTDGFERIVLLEQATYMAGNVSFSVEINKKTTKR